MINPSCYSPIDWASIKSFGYLFKKSLNYIFFFLILLGLIGCGGDKAEKPYLKFIGGGFIFNYRIAEVSYGFVLGVKRALPKGAIIKVAFEDPSSSAPIIIERKSMPGRSKYDFSTPALKGVKPDKPYTVIVELIEQERQQVIAKYSKQFKTHLDQSVLPEIAPTYGPGYHRNPQLDQVRETRSGPDLAPRKE